MHSHGPAGWTRERECFTLIYINTKRSQHKKSNSKLVFRAPPPFLMLPCLFSSRYISSCIYVDEIHFCIMHAGLKFWKSPRRKVYAVLKSDLEQKLRGKGKRSQPIMLDDSDDDDAPSKRMKSVDTLLESMQEDITEIVAAVCTIKELDKDSAVPNSLKHLIRDAFKCKICLRVPLSAPPIISKCCKTILGCETCVNEWYSGEDALTKSCPLCRSE